MTPLDFKDAILGLVATDVEDAYEGTDVNDRTLGKMYYLKRYEKASGDLYDMLRSTLTPPTTADKQAFANDGKFIATVQQRSGRKTIDAGLILGELTDLLYKLQLAQKVKTPSKNKAVIEAGKILETCTLYGKDSTIVTVVEAASC